MGVPAGSNAMSVGRGGPDLAAIETIEDVVNALKFYNQVLIGMGYVCPAYGSDPAYQNVIYKDGDFYGGKPSDPTNPDLLLSSAGGTIVVQEEGTPLTARGIINFIGASVTAADDAGNTRTNVTIVGGSTDSFVTITCDSGSIVADSATDTATFVGGDGIVTTGTAGSDTITWDVDLDTAKGLEIVSNKIAANIGDGLEFDGGGAIAAKLGSGLQFDGSGAIEATGSGTVTEAFKNIACSGESDIVADGPTDTFTLAAGSGLGWSFNAATDTATISHNITRMFRTTSAITAAVWSGTTLTLGTGDAEMFVAEGTPDVWELDGNTHTLKNMVEVEIDSGKNVKATRQYDGSWLIDVEDCS